MISKWTKRAVLPLGCAASFYLAWVVFAYFIAASPPLTALAEAVPVPMFYPLTFGWFLVLGICACVVPVAVWIFAVRKTGLIASERSICIITMATVLTIEAWRQFVLASYEDIWRWSIFNSFRVAFVAAFLAVTLAAYRWQIARRIRESDAPL